MNVFDPLPGFTENWFPAPSQEALAGLVRSVADVDGLLVEIGSWEGRSTTAMANAAWPHVVCAVDTWNGSPGEISSELAGKRDVFVKFLANVRHFTKGNVEPFRMDWRDFVAGINEPVALCFIDAEHSYKEVRDNVLAVLPLMAAGGVLCGDDAHHPPVQQALDEIFGLATLEREATLWIHRVPS